QAALAAIAQAGVFAAAGTVYLSTELWAGVLVALSVLAYARRQAAVGFGAALAALFFRELALLYCVVCVVRAGRRERVAWAVGLAAYGGYFALHASRVTAHLAHVAHDPGRSWLAFGGLGFVLATLRANGILFSAASWVRPLLLP